MLFRRMLSLGRRRGEKGQSLAIFAIGGVAFIALAGLAIDVGQVVVARTDLQKSADAAALAGAQNLPNSLTASNIALAYVDGNSPTGTDAEVAVTKTYTANDTIEVKNSRRVSYTFLRVVGLDGADISAKAKARLGNYQGGRGLLPWGLISNTQNSCFLGFVGGNPTFKQNESCQLKDGAPGQDGDFGAVALDGVGANDYRDDIINGSSGSFKIGDKILPQTGNMKGPTQQGADDRFALPPPSGCAGNTMSDVLKTNADGSVSIKPGCEDSGRIILIPVVDKIDNPHESTILGFAFMFLEDIKNQGGHTVVKARFVEFRTAIPGGDYGGAIDRGATAVRLVE